MCCHCKHWKQIHSEYGSCPKQLVDFVPYSIPSNEWLKKQGYSRKEREQEISKIYMENIYWQSRKEFVTSRDYVCSEYERNV